MSLRHPILAAARQFLSARWRDRRLAGSVLLLVLSVTALWASHQRIQSYEAHRTAAQAQERDTWLAQGERNPHTVAHFSRFAFKPASAALLLDGGVIDYLGSAVWLEAHWQRPANFRAAEDRVDLGRFADLHLAWVWQVLGALAVIALGFDAIAGERDRGTLALLAGNGISLRQFALGMALGLAVLILSTVLVTFGIAQLTASRLTAELTGEYWSRSLLWLAAHGIFLLTLVGIVIGVSARARSARTALAWLLVMWVSAVLLLPRTAANVAEQARPIPSAAQFWLQITRDIEHGLDNDGPASARARALEVRTLAQYGVASTDKLPISYAGISLQADEEYGIRVFDRRFRELEQNYRKQANLQLAIGSLSPLSALQVLSSGAAGADVGHHLAFTRQAEAQRRIIIARLNANMTEHGAGRDFQYFAPADFWSTFNDIVYPVPSIGSLMPQYAAAALVALLWLSIASAWLYGGIVRLVRQPLMSSAH